SLERGYGSLLDDPTFGVSGRGTRAERHGEAVALASSQDLARHLGGLSKADRQHAGRERVEAADVACLLAGEQGPHPLQRGVRRQAVRLVEQQDAAGHGRRASAPWRIAAWRAGALRLGLTRVVFRRRRSIGGGGGVLAIAGDRAVDEMSEPGCILDTLI